MADEERRLRFLRNWYAAYGAAGQDGQTVDSVSGRLLTFDTKYALPLVSLKLNIEAVQSGSGDPSPTNIRPITGFGGASIYHSGADTSDYTTYTVTWTDAGTVYGGTLDINSGMLIVTHAYKKISDLTWYYDSNYTRFSCSPSPLPDDTYGTREVPIISTAYYTVDDGRPIANVPNFSIYGSGTASIYIKDNRFTSAASFVSSMGNEGFYYPIRYKQTYNLTPLQITTLIGTNNIWSNAGTLEAEYIR